MILVVSIFMNKKSRCSFAAAFLFLWLAITVSLSACAPQDSSYRWSGQTMGTYYKITLSQISGNEQSELELLKKRAAELLVNLNNSLSTYIPNSEINDWNRLAGGECLQVSDWFLEVVVIAQDVAKASDYQFNPLIAPLVNRWGFGSNNSEFKFPVQQEVDALLINTEFDNLIVKEGVSKLCKKEGAQHTSMDLSAVAKGFAVDHVAQMLTEKGFKHFLVDIGGEMRVSGFNPDSVKWRLAIEKPVQSLQAVQQILTVTDRSIATSGDYRNYFDYQGQRYSHTINPKTGYPVKHNMTSVTVIAEQAAVADAWATALLAAGPERSKKWVDLYGLAVYFITRENSYTSTDQSTIDQEQPVFNSWYSEAFKPYLQSD